MKRTTLFALALVVVGFGGAQNASAQVNFYLQNSVNLGTTGLNLFGGTSGNDAGFEPIAITSDGDTVYVGGGNVVSSQTRSGVIRLSNPWSNSASGVLMTQTAFTAANTRGITGLKLRNDQLLVSLDNGTASTSGLRSFVASTGALQWSSAVAVRGNGASFDPGFNGSGFGAATGSLGSGRRVLVNETTGANIYDTTNGLIWFGSPVTGGNIRDMDFDANGDIYVRSSNLVLKGTRNGANSLSARSVVVQNGSGNGNGPNSSGQNLALFTHDGVTSIIWNDRADGIGANNTFVSRIKANKNDGSAISINWFNADGTAAPTLANSDGRYDFHFEADGDLLVLDSFNRTLHRFSSSPVPEPATMIALGMGALALIRRKRSK